MNRWFAILHYHASKIVRRTTLPAIICALIVYFVIQAYTGDRGLPIHNDLRSRVAVAQSELADLKAIRERLEHRVSLIDPRKDNPPLLEDIAREKLKLVGPDELVIMRDR